MKILSISVAAYNVENYLQKTLDAFCIPEIMDDIEVLIIDDGSKDNTHLIAEDYQDRYPDTFRYIKKENGGHGSTVNKGIELATGKYFKVVDGDDWISRDDFIKMIEYMKDTSADLIFTDYYRVSPEENMTPVMYFQAFEPYRIYTMADIPSFDNVSMHSIAVKSDILKANQVHLTENCFYVDIEYVVYILHHVDTIQYLPLYVYMYRYGTPNQSVNMKNMVKNIEMRVKVSTGLTRYLAQYQNDPEWNSTRFRMMKNKVSRMIGGTCMVYLAFDDIHLAKKELLMYESTIQDIIPELYHSSGRDMKVRAMRICRHLFFGFENRFYRWLKM